MKAKIDKESSAKLKQYKNASKAVAAKMHDNKKEEQKKTTSKAGLIKMAFGFAFVIVLLISLIASLGDYAQSASELQSKAVISENGKIIPLPSPSALPEDLNPVEAKICTIPDTVEATALEAIKEQVNKAKELQLPIEVINDFGISFRFIPKGKFLMGSPETEPKREAVEFQHKASVDEHFYMSKFEVTEKQWETIMGTKAPDSRGPSYPVVKVSLNDAQEFIRKLNEKFELPEGTYDLPTETEWEYACRTWTSTPYFFGFDQDLVLRYDFSRESAGERRAIKGETLPNAWGLYNMIGNVGEWTSTPFWIYECPDNAYAPSWDKAIYDGDKVGADDQPLNNFTSPLRTPGIQTGIYYADELQVGKGQYSKGEFIWKDGEGGKGGIYDYEFDHIITDGGNPRDFKALDGFQGLQNKLYYADENKDGSWTEGEDIWLLDSKNRYENSEYVFRGGFWITHVEGCRSAARYSITRDSSSNFIGFRIIRRLHDIKAIEKIQNDSNTPSTSSVSE